MTNHKGAVRVAGARLVPMVGDHLPLACRMQRPHHLERDEIERGVDERGAQHEVHIHDSSVRVHPASALTTAAQLSLNPRESRRRHHRTRNQQSAGAGWPLTPASAGAEEATI